MAQGTLRRRVAATQSTKWVTIGGTPIVWTLHLIENQIKVPSIYIYIVSDNNFRVFELRKIRNPFFCAFFCFVLHFEGLCYCSFAPAPPCSRDSNAPGASQRTSAVPTPLLFPVPRFSKQANMGDYFNLQISDSKNNKISWSKIKNA